MSTALNFVVNPKKFFSQILSCKNENGFVAYLLAGSIILSLYDLRNYTGSFDSAAAFISTTILLILGLMKLPLLLYSFAFVIGKLSNNKRKNENTEPLFRVIAFSIFPVLIIALAGIIFPHSKSLPFLMQVLMIWSFILWTNGHSYVCKISALRSEIITILPFLLWCLVGSIINH